MTTSHLTGLRIFARERRAAGHFISRLPAGVVRPSFDETNFADVPLLESKVREGMAKMGLGQGTVAVLLPELCARVFILNLDSIPGVPKGEGRRSSAGGSASRCPSFPRTPGSSIRDSPPGVRKGSSSPSARSRSSRSTKVCSPAVSLAVGNVSLPSLSLLDLLPAAGEDVLVVNVEEDSLSFVAVIDSELSLYRQKPFAFDRTRERPSSSRSGDSLKEVENTMHFLEDKEKKRVRSLWFRSGLPDDGRRHRRRTPEALWP